jgi:hypothetical protein
MIENFSSTDFSIVFVALVRNHCSTSIIVTAFVTVADVFA